MVRIVELLRALDDLNEPRAAQALAPRERSEQERGTIVACV
jgi:hypothetical protein